MKRRQIALLAPLLALCLALSACGGSNAPAVQSEPEVPTQSDTEAIPAEEILAEEPVEEPPTIDAAPYAGEWLNYFSGEPALTVRADGTVTIYGEKGRIISAGDDTDVISGVGVNLTIETDSNSEYSLGYFQDARVGGDSERLAELGISAVEGMGMSQIYLGMEGYAGAFFMDYSTHTRLVPADAGFEWLTVEINNDNWADYLYIGEEYEDQFDAFGDWTGVRQDCYLYLKDGYLITSDGSLTLEYSYQWNMLEVSLDREAQTWTELSREERNSGTAQDTVNVYRGEYRDLMHIGGGGSITEDEYEGGYYLETVSEEILRIQGELQLIKIN
ncbi:MAG: hypothetical protein IJ751_09920 [Oscillospiraceae bacterium]|nr:hypothetical protein [Oscillospiraceae bacterium]